MPLRFFRKENSSVSRREREEQLERAVVNGFRKLSGLLQKAADLIEAQRLERGGFEKQEKFLERTEHDAGGTPPGAKSSRQTGSR